METRFVTRLTGGTGAAVAQPLYEPTQTGAAIFTTPPTSSTAIRVL